MHMQGEGKRKEKDGSKVVREVLLRGRRVDSKARTCAVQII